MTLAKMSHGSDVAQTQPSYPMLSKVVLNAWLVLEIVRLLES
jgi:hypothetical protein